MSTSIEQIKLEAEKLTNQTKESLKTVKVIALAQAWKILQLVVAAIIQIIEEIGADLSSPEKKLLAMDCVSKFYDSVFLVIDVPFVPNMIEPIIHKHVKSILMILVSSTIDAMVTTFRNAGVFVDPSAKVNSILDVIPKVSEK
jgi:ABC-type lipopolysaccharide export system ATPase subunit